MNFFGGVLSFMATILGVLQWCYDTMKNYEFVCEREGWPGIECRAQLLCIH